MRRYAKFGSSVVGTALAAAMLLGCSSVEEVAKEVKNEAKEEVKRLDDKEFAVVYEVIGSGVEDLAYGAMNGGKLTEETVDKPQLPWKKELSMKGITSTPNLSVMLGADGGQAECVIKVNGKEVERKTAKGAFGTAACVAMSGSLDEK
ncbi:MmpS family transport accessory protein [Streptomyces sp. NPDC003077]|uniref:MmpS family transport accessory protein n=1 Tax=Streptomyces sp. NPDC003077 TaxID=3154443 RepID=UPI0033B007DA